MDATHRSKTQENKQRSSVGQAFNCAQRCTSFDSTMDVGSFGGGLDERELRSGQICVAKAKFVSEQHRSESREPEESRERLKSGWFRLGRVGGA
jgi:hypothetical protein